MNTAGASWGSPKRSRLFWKIFAVLLLSVSVAAASFFALSLAWARSYSTAWLDEVTSALEDHETQLADASQSAASLEAPLREIGSDHGASLQVWMPRDLRSRVDRGELTRRELSRMRRGRTVVRADDPVRGATALWPLSDPETGELLGAIEIRPPRSRRGWLPLAILLVSATIAAGTWLLAGNLSRRLEWLSRATKRISDGELDAPSETQLASVARPWFGDEIDEVTDDFERMRGRIAALVEGQRRLLANVSHELRTPIARMRVTLDLADERQQAGLPLDAIHLPHAPEGMSHQAPPAGDEKIQQTSDGTVLQSLEARSRAELARSITDLRLDLRELSVLVDDLLTAGRLELGDRVRREPTDVLALLEAATDRFAADLESDGPCLLDVDPLLLDRIIRNLLSNARRATPDGAILVRCTSRGSDAVHIVVRDDGAGVPEALREHIFAPFSRLDAARDRDRGGAGLGLYLCRQIARAHGGSLQARDRSDGRSGAEFLVVLPASTRLADGVALPLQPTRATR